MLELKNITWSLPDGREVIKDVSLSIPKGKLVVVTGPNGGGKTTLAKIIAGIATPDSGKLILEGEDITELADCNIRKVEEIKEKILSFCKPPISFENLLKKLFDYYSKKMNFDQYALVGCTTRSYLAALKNAGKLDVKYDENIMTWESV